MKTLKVKFVCADTQERAVTAYHETGKELEPAASTTSFWQYPYPLQEQSESRK